MVDPIAVADQSVRHAAQIEQAIPVGIVARHTGDFQAEHDAYMSQCNFRGHVCEPRTFRPSRTGETEVFINDDHLFFCPTQLTGFLNQSILPSRGLTVVLHLRRTGLANVDKSGALRMAWFYLAEITHGSSPRPGCVETS